MQYFLKKIKNKSAQSMIELALSLPVLIVLLSVMISCAQMVYIKQVATNAIAAGVRVAITCPSSGNELPTNGYSKAQILEFKDKASQSNNEKMYSKVYRTMEPIIESAGFNIDLRNITITKKDTQDGNTQRHQGLANSGLKSYTCSVTLEAPTLMPVIHDDGTFSSEVICTETIVAISEADVRNK